MTQKATKKPVQIEFVIYDGNNDKEIMDFTNGGARLKSTVPFSPDAPDRDRGYILVITTLESEEQIVSLNDRVIKGIKGEFYPCKEDVFNGSYDVN